MPYLYKQDKVSVIYLDVLSPTHSIVLPSDVYSKALGRAALMTPVYMNFQLPRCTARMSPHDWWALTPTFSPLPLTTLAIADQQPCGCVLKSGGYFLLHGFALTNDFPLRSGMLYVARTFLVCHKKQKRRTAQLLMVNSTANVVKNRENKVYPRFF